MTKITEQKAKELKAEFEFYFNLLYEVKKENGDDGAKKRGLPMDNTDGGLYSNNGDLSNETVSNVLQFMQIEATKELSRAFKEK